MVGPDSGVRAGRGGGVAAGDVAALHVGAELTAAGVQRRGRGAGGRRVARPPPRGRARGGGHHRPHGRGVRGVGRRGGRAH